MKRGISWLLTLIGLVLVPAFAWWRGQQFLDEQRAQDGFACGMPILGLYLLAVVVAGLLSLVATVLNGLAFRALPAPRHPLRILELVVIAAPLMLAAVFVAVFIVG